MAYSVTAKAEAAMKACRNYARYNAGVACQPENSMADGGQVAGMGGWRFLYGDISGRGALFVAHTPPCASTAASMAIDVDKRDGACTALSACAAC